MRKSTFTRLLWLIAAAGLALPAVVAADARSLSELTVSRRLDTAGLARAYESGRFHLFLHDVDSLSSHRRSSDKAARVESRRYAPRKENAGSGAVDRGGRRWGVDWEHTRPVERRY